MPDMMLSQTSDKSNQQPANHHVEQIPAMLRGLPNWVVFRTYPKPDGRLGKTPLIPGTTRHASISDPATWRTFDVALADATARGLSLGVAITTDMNITLLDIDGQTDHPLIAELDSYAERSVSGTGIHILVQGHPPASAIKPPGIEVYPGKRFMLITGELVDGRGTIEDRAAQLATLFPAQPTRGAVQPASPATLDDETIAARTIRMETGRRLHQDGDRGGYPSGSEADLALLNCYVRAGASDPEQLDRLYQRSALHPQRKAEWSRRNYRERTIARALDGRVVPFDGWDAPSIPHDVAPGTDVSDSERGTEAMLRRELAKVMAALAARDAKIVILEQKIDTLEAVQSATGRILANKAHGPTRVTAATIANQIAWRATAGGTPPKERGIDVPIGMMAIAVSDIAARAGVSENTAGDHLKLLTDRGFIRRETRKVRRDVDERTGEIHDKPVFITQHFIGPATTGPLTPQGAITLATTLADFAMERIEKRGGKRTPRCAEHPTAAVIRAFTDSCEVCHKTLHAGSGPLPAMMLDPIPGGPFDRSTNFGDHYPDVVDVLLAPNIGDQSQAPSSPNPNFGDHAAATFLFSPEPSRSYHFDIGD